MQLGAFGPIAGAILLTAAATGASGSPARPGVPEVQRPITELKPEAVIHLGETADWVAIGPDSVWVGSTGPNAVHRIDPRSGRVTDRIVLPGEPCSGLAVAGGVLWVPLCGEHPQLVAIDTRRGEQLAAFPVPQVFSEGGVAAADKAGGGGVFLITDEAGTLTEFDPKDGHVRRNFQVGAGAHNPRYAQGRVYVTHVAGSGIAIVDPKTGKVSEAPTGPNPRFLTVGAGRVWTLNQGDGGVSQIALSGLGPALPDIALKEPGHGGDIAYGGGRIWTTMRDIPLSLIDPRTGRVLRQWVGPGGDSLNIGFGAIWLTDYRAGTVSKIALKAALKL